MIVAATGHRPNKIGGFEFSNPKRVWIRDRIRDQLVSLKPNTCISGMALGIDQDFAFISIEMGIPFIAAIPFEGQESKWPLPSQRFFNELLALASRIEIVSPGGYAAWKMQVRNEFLVDECNVLLAIWDGSKGGTYNCIQYATKVNREIRRINPNDYRG